jgi:putative transposase
VDSQSIKTTAVGGEQRGYDGGKKVKGRKRHLLVDTEGFGAHSAGPQRKGPQDPKEGIKLLLELAQDRLPPAPFSPVDGDAGYTGEGKGADWVEKVLGWTAQTVRHPPKLAPEEVMRRWVREWAREGVAIDPEELSAARGFGGLPRRWVVERAFSWLGQNRRMSLGTTKGWPRRARRSST